MVSALTLSHLSKRYGSHQALDGGFTWGLLTEVLI